MPKSDVAIVDVAIVRVIARLREEGGSLVFEVLPCPGRPNGAGNVTGIETLLDGAAVWEPEDLDGAEMEVTFRLIGEA